MAPHTTIHKARKPITNRVVDHPFKAALKAKAPAEEGAEPKAKKNGGTSPEETAMYPGAAWKPEHMEYLMEARAPGKQEPFSSISKVVGHTNLACRLKLGNLLKAKAAAAAPPPLTPREMNAKPDDGDKGGYRAFDMLVQASRDALLALERSQQAKAAQGAGPHDG
ncbi:hypothetical protein LTR53_012502 [Teratosphaeriaceae sp. CCFEE 6253]|nr:hypothetical protein LTR53_012502 [Teratosphaeriaceae sp. CCFEE 6253]